MNKQITFVLLVAGGIVVGSVLTSFLLPMLTKKAVKEANAERFVALKTDLGQQAKALLSEGRLNHTTFTKLISNKASLTDKKLSKPKYDAIIKELIDNEIAEKKGLNYIYK